MLFCNKLGLCCSNPETFCKRHVNEPIPCRLSFKLYILPSPSSAPPGYPVVHIAKSNHFLYYYWLVCACAVHGSSPTIFKIFFYIIFYLFLLFSEYVTSV